MIKYILVSDNSGHDYVIPSDKGDDWYDWLELPEDTPNSYVLPDYAKKIEGGLEFETPTENGKPLFDLTESQLSDLYYEEYKAEIIINEQKANDYEY